MAEKDFSFFENLRIIEKNIADPSSYFPSETISLFNDLVSFVEEAAWSNSVSTKFICANWRKSSSEVTKLWNEDHRQKPKSNNTFRSQISTCCTQLYSLLGADVLNIFSLENYRKDGTYSDEVRIAMYRLKSLVSYFSVEDFNFNEFAIQEVSAYTNGGQVEVFNLDDCANEIEAIKTLRRNSIYSYLDTLDTEKLSYLRSILNSPLMNTSTRKANATKIDLLKRLDTIPCERYFKFANVGLHQSYEEIEVDETTVVNIPKEAKDEKPIEVTEEVSDFSFEETIEEGSLSESVVEPKVEKETIKEGYDLESIVNRYCLTEFGCNLEQVKEMVKFSKEESSIFSAYKISSAKAIIETLTQYAKLNKTKPAMSDEVLQVKYNSIGLTIPVTHDLSILYSIMHLLLSDNLKFFLAGYTSGDVANILNNILPINPTIVAQEEENKSEG